MLRESYTSHRGSDHGNVTRVLPPIGTVDPSCPLGPRSETESTVGTQDCDGEGEGPTHKDPAGVGERSESTEWTLLSTSRKRY